LLEAAGLKAVPTGIDHGTVTAVALHRPFEITTLRRDVETYGRRAKVAFTDDWTLDAARRDFTFNAMSCTPDGWLHDPFGGAADPAAVIALMREQGVLAHFLPEALNLTRLARLTAIEAGLGLEAAPPRRLAALLEDEAAALAVTHRFRLSNALRDRVLQALAE